MVTRDWRRFAESTRPDPQTTRRLAERALARSGSGRRAPRWIAGSAVVLAAAAALGLWLRAGGEPLALELAQVDVQATPEIHLRADGEGSLSGTRRDARLDWRAGRVEVEVTPGQGIAFAIDTPEARVRVVGTRFAVTRDALGTRVHVEHGVVEVTCDGLATARFEAGTAAECLPTDAAGWLARALALGEAGAGAEQVLAAARAGMAAPDQPPIVDELQALEVAALADLGRTEEARSAGRRLLARGGGVRRGQVARRLSGTEPCDLTFARAAAESAGAAMDWVRLAECLGGGPAAHAALERAAAVARPDERPLVEAWRARILDE